MNVNILFRQTHHWGAIIIALPVLVMIGAGILLMLKKNIDWIQPPTFRGSGAAELPTARLDDLFRAAARVPEAGFTAWSDLDRVDIKPDRGIVKFIGHNRWEVQVDIVTLAPVQVAYRRSDLIESIHDGSWFASFAKLWLFLPAGIGLFILWLTGIWLFFLPHIKRARRRAAQGR